MIGSVSVDEARAETYRRAGYWRDETLDDRFAAAVRRDPSRIAVVDRRGSISYGELADRVERLAGSLRELGVNRGDRVVVQLPNITEFVVAHLALERLGAITCPIVTQYRRADIEPVLARTESVAAIVPSEYRNHDHLTMWQEIRRAQPRDLKLVVVGEPQASNDGGVYRFDDLANGRQVVPYQPGPRNGDEVTLVIFTSGTVASKGVMHTHNSTWYGATFFSQELGLDSDSVVWMPSPVSHGTGLQWGVRLAIHLGAKLVLQDRWSGAEAVDLVAREGCQVMVGATPFVYDLRAAGAGRREDLRSLRYLVCAGAPIPDGLVRGMRDELGVQILRGYGMSEHFVSTICRPDDPEHERLFSDGRPLPGTEVAVFSDDRSRMLPPGQEGELAVRGPGVAVGYLRDPERTRQTWTSDGWQFSEDLAKIDEHGFVRISGRKKDLIIRGGFNISPSEIESMLIEHPNVREVGVVGIPDERLGERICAAVVPDGPAPSLESLTSFLLSRGVSKLKLPELVVIRDALPRTPSGKIKKDVLRKGVAAQIDERGKSEESGT